MRIKCLIVFTAMFLLFCPCQADAGWMDNIRQNQQIAIDYMYTLQGNPNAPRPNFHPSEGWKAKRAMDEISRAIARAEQQAAAGRQIQIPVFRFGPDDSGWE